MDAIRRMLADFKKSGIVTHLGTRLEQTTRQGASVIDADGRRFIIEAETIVFAIEAEANRDVWQQVRHIAAEAYLIGDALRPRSIREAILEGHLVGHRLSLSHRENP